MLRRKRLNKTKSLSTKIALGLSGGVDSATSAAFLLNEGYSVLGITCVFHDDAATEQALESAQSVCRFLGITHIVYDARKIFEETVIEIFLAANREGQTPSPCVFCNRFCKIPVLYQAAYDYGCNKIATGHYARVVELVDSKRFALKKALDETKDQSYMLSLLTQDQLEDLVLPLGGYTKQEVRAYAHDLAIPVAHRPESQDLCFVEGDYRDFLLSRGIEDTPGDIVTAQGKVVGKHEGLFRYTLGQRKGLKVALGVPYYVIEKDVALNRLVVAAADQALITALSVENVNWQALDKLAQPLECQVKIRYRSHPVAATVLPDKENPAADSQNIVVRLHKPQPLTAPGQYCVLYQGSLMLGGGIITGLEFTRSHSGS